MENTDHQTKRTHDHDEIKDWAEKRGGRPAKVEGTANDGSALLRIDFAEGDESLEEISWEDFFRIFDENDLDFIYQDELKDGETSRFFKLVERE